MTNRNGVIMRVWTLSLFTLVSLVNLGCGPAVSKDNSSAAANQPGEYGTGQLAKAPPTEPEAAVGEMNINGIDFELPWKVDAAEALEAVNDGGIVLNHDQLSLEVKDERVSVNGKSFGQIQKGDRVKLTNVGRVFVNGKERTPEAVEK